MRHKLHLDQMTQMNIKKVTQFRENGAEELKALADEFAEMGDFEGELPAKKRVYPAWDEDANFNRLRQMQARSQDMKKNKHYYPMEG